MENTLPAVAERNRIPIRHWRLLSLAGLLVVVVTAPWWLFLPSVTIYSFGAQIFVPAATSTTLLVFAVVTALLDMRQGTRWLIVFGVVIAESLNHHALGLIAVADYLDDSPALLDSLRNQTALHLVIGLGLVVAIDALLWPFRALLGWQVHWEGKVSAPQERSLTIWHLAGSLALAAILLVYSGPSTDPFLRWQFTSLLANLAVGLPLLILATQRKHLSFIPAALAGFIGLTLAEWGLSNFIDAVTGGGSGFSLWSWVIWNGIVTGAVLFIVFLLRWAGLRFYLPISRRSGALGRNPIDGIPASSYGRRRFQFSLRSVLLLTTLLCLGPGSYIAWEREKCRRGSETLARIETLLGKQNSTEQRPAWLQAVLGNHSFRQLRLIYSKQTTTTDADLECLSGLPNIDTLILDRTQVTGVGLDSLTHAKALVVLQLSGAQVSDEGLVHLIPLTGLRHLTLDKTKVTDAGLVHLSGLTNLRTLLLRDTMLTNDGLAHLTPLVNLQHLHIDNTEVRDAGLNHLPANLKSLRLSGTKVTDTGLVHLTRLTQLSYLSLENTNVTNDGLARLSSLENLEYLFLDNTGVGDAGLKKLSADLKSLGLSGTKVTNTGLATISRLTKLENLNLSNNSITDAGLVTLEDLPNLQKLTVTNTEVTAAGAANLNKKLPALKIKR